MERFVGACEGTFVAATVFAEPLGVDFPLLGDVRDGVSGVLPRDSPATPPTLEITVTVGPCDAESGKSGRG